MSWTRPSAESSTHKIVETHDERTREGLRTRGLAAGVAAHRAHLATLYGAWRRHAVVVAALVLSALSLAVAGEPPMNLTTLKRSCVRYHDSGEYLADIAAVDAKAEAWLDENASVPKAAVVLDIDETSVSNWAYEKRLDFGFDRASFDAFLRDTKAEAIAPTHALVAHAQRLRMAIFFITGRREPLRAVTEGDLREAGYSGWNGLDLAPEDYHEPTISIYKSAARKRITEMGYHIVANVGDQESDLAGGYADRGFKLPNPFYLVP